jgi:hypothetical protein
MREWQLNGISLLSADSGITLQLRGSSELRGCLEPNMKKDPSLLCFPIQLMDGSDSFLCSQRAASMQSLELWETPEWGAQPSLNSGAVESQRLLTVSGVARIQQMCSDVSISFFKRNELNWAPFSEVVVQELTAVRDSEQPLPLYSRAAAHHIACCWCVTPSQTQRHSSAVYGHHQICAGHAETVSVYASVCHTPIFNVHCWSSILKLFVRMSTLYTQKLALTSPTSGGCSVGIVRSRTQATEISLSEKKKKLSL